MEAAIGKAGGQLIQGAAGQEAAKYNRDVLKAQAGDALAMGSAQELQVRNAAREQMGKQVASAAESGFAPGTGSSLTLLEESAINAELDALNLRRAAAAKASALKAQAKMANNTGIMAMRAAMFEASATVASAIAGAPGGAPAGVNYGG
jgi:hypothetical protein